MTYGVGTLRCLRQLCGCSGSTCAYTMPCSAGSRAQLILLIAKVSTRRRVGVNNNKLWDQDEPDIPAGCDQAGMDRWLFRVSPVAGDTTSPEKLQAHV